MVRSNTNMAFKLGLTDGQTGIGFPARLRVSHQNRKLNTNFRRNGKLQSCEPCRKGKLRCDHMMPACGRCTRRNKAEQCVYHPAPLTKATTIPTPEPSDASSSVEVSQEDNSASLSVFSLPFPPVEAVPATQPRFARASSLPAQTSSSGHLSLGELRRPFPDNQTIGDSIRFQQTADFISHSAILAENEVSIGILPAPESLESMPTSKIPQSHIERGVLVLALLKELPVFDKYMEKLFSFLRGIIVIEPMVKIWSTYLWSTWHKVLEAQKADGLRQLSEKIWENTTKPLSLNRNTRPRDFAIGVTGDGLRWEVVGILLTLVGFLAQSLQDGDPIFCSHDDPPVDRAALALKTFNASEACVSFCKDFDIMNDLFLWLLYEHTILSCSLHAKGSYHNWQCSGYLCQALIAFGLHQEIKVDDQTPFFITELRKRVFVCAYENDKYTASFVGRPPRLPRHYCLIQLPLDLNDVQLMSDGLDLDSALSKLDPDGWNQRGMIQRCTFARIFASNGLITEEILEISLGNLSSEEIVSRAADIERRADELWENLPAFLKTDGRHPFDLKRAPIELIFLAYIRLAGLGHKFLLQRTLIKKVGADSGKLLAVSREMFSFILVMTNNKDVFRDFQMDFTQLLCMNGIPSAAIVAIELLNQEQNNTLTLGTTTPLPRSDTIQDLSVFAACLAGIRPDSGGYPICDRGRRFIKKILDTILNPPRQELTNIPINDGFMNASNLSMPLFQAGSDGDFMKWLESMEWEQESWSNLT